METTRQMFEMSKETVELEAQAFEMGQRVRLGEEARGVLDSWVRYEGQVKARQQREVAEGVMGRVGRELENPKVLERILQQSVQDVEREFFFSLFCFASTLFVGVFRPRIHLSAVFSPFSMAGSL